MTEQHRRLEETRTQNVLWKKWGPYLSERQRGTVREDYSESCNAWDYVPHRQARSACFQLRRSGLAAFSDERQVFCCVLTLWRGAASTSLCTLSLPYRLQKPVGSPLRSPLVVP